jgi:hypothetical protein
VIAHLPGIAVAQRSFGDEREDAPARISRSGREGPGSYAEDYRERTGGGLLDAEVNDSGAAGGWPRRSSVAGTGVALGLHSA